MNIRSCINIIESAQPRVNFNDAFWSWFGNSKVVDSDGNPLMVFHGTTKDIKKFDLRGKFRTGGKAYFFTSNPIFAHAYANKGNGIGGQIYPVFLKIQNMFDYKNKQHFDALESKVDAYLQHEKDTKGPYKANSFYPYTKSRVFATIATGEWHGFEHNIIIMCLQKAGFDGCMMTEGDALNFMVFSANQIKSVYNSGSWSTTNPNIDK